MTKKSTIRIVKKGELSRATEAAAETTVVPTEEDSARTMTKTVTGWIREFKEKSDLEAGKLLAAFENNSRLNQA